MNTFHISLSRDGAPFGKDNAALACLVSFLNLGRGVLNSNKNVLMFGGNCKEYCVPESCFFKTVVH